MKNMFKGWSTVFGFTFKEAVKAKGFLTTTILIAVLLFALLGGANLYFGMSAEEKQTETETIKDVRVVNKSGIPMGFSMFSYLGEKYKDASFIEADSVEQAKKQCSEEGLAVSVEKKEKEYLIRVYAGKDCTLDEDTVEGFSQDFTSYFEKFKVAVSGVDQDQAAVLNSEVMYDMAEAGEKNQSIGVMMFYLFAPMILYLVLYMMIILYGQSISKVVISEKSSKLMELLLTSVKPYAIIMGKILGMASVAIMQFMIWIASGAAGFVVGHLIAKSMAPDYENLIVTLIKLIQSDSEGAFSIPVVIASILLLMFGFVFYCVLAGLVSSNISKPEELSSKMGLFMIPAVVSFMAVYMLPMAVEGNFVTQILRYIPFTGAYCLSADLITGQITMVEMIIPFLIMLATTFIMVVVTGKIYKKKIF